MEKLFLMFFLSVLLEMRGIIALIIAIFLVLTFVVRRNFLFKAFFTSKLNFLTSKFYYKELYDLPRDLFYEKVKEVVKNDRHYKLLNENKDKYQLLLGTSISIWSFGENIYLEFVEEDESTKLVMTSVAFQMISWGRNKSNIKQFIDQINASLVI